MYISVCKSQVRESKHACSTIFLLSCISNPRSLNIIYAVKLIMMVIKMTSLDCSQQPVVNMTPTVGYLCKSINNLLILLYYEHNGLLG